MIRRRRRRLAVAMAILAAVVAGATLGFLGGGTHAATGDPTNGFYLDIGASASLGVQPTGNPKHNGAFTDEGYGNDVVTIEAARGVTLSLAKIGCMGETAESMAGVGDHCYVLPKTQLSVAAAFLRAHHNDTGLVSIDIGFNDVRPCLWVVPLDEACVNKGIAAVREDLPKVLHELTGAAGPNVHFVGLTYGDPFLFRYLKAAPGPARATQSLTDMTSLDTALSQVYGAAGIPVADVAKVYKSDDTTMTTLAGHGRVPTNVAEICRLTWMCAARPWGPDDHPNKTGYTVIARTILAAVPVEL